MTQNDSIVPAPVVPPAHPAVVEETLITVASEPETASSEPEATVSTVTPPVVAAPVDTASRHYVQNWGQTWAATPADTTLTAPVDTVPHTYGIALKAPVIPKVKENVTDNFGMSIVTGGLILLFCIIGFRFHNNRKYVSALFRNLIDVRERTNVFDDTVRETSFMVLLNLLWSCSAGILLYGLLCFTVKNDPAASFGIPALHLHPAWSIGVCMGVGVVYTCFMALAYYMVGNVFAGKAKAVLWLKGFTAGQGFLSFVYFLLGLLLLSHPEWVLVLLWVAAGWLILAKIIFIWKGFRIFFTQISSWVLFLYYLCSLEIVPLILTYLAAVLICGYLH